MHARVTVFVLAAAWIWGLGCEKSAPSKAAPVADHKDASLPPGPAPLKPPPPTIKRASKGDCQLDSGVSS